MNDRLIEASAQPNGSGSTPAPVSACALAELPPSVHQYIHALEQRIAILEANQEKFLNATKFVGSTLFAPNSPFKMFTAALPKDMKEKIQSVFGNSNGVTGKS